MHRAKLEIYDSPRLRPFLTTMSCFLLFILCDQVRQGVCELHVILQWTLYEVSGGYGAERINCVYTHIETGCDNTFQPVPENKAEPSAFLAQSYFSLHKTQDNMRI